MIWQRLCAPLEKMVDPYSPSDAEPPAKTWPYLRQSLWPLRWVMALSIAATLGAAAIEVWLISYAGRLVDSLSAIPREDLWQQMGPELLTALVVLLILRPVVHFLREATNDLALKPASSAIYRWRAIRHVAHQSVGWFQDDFTGRTAHRAMEIGSHAAGAIYHAMNAVAYVGVYLIGTVALFAAVDPVLVLPLGLWLAAYTTFFLVILKPFMQANSAFHESRSMLVGKLVDAFSNISTLRMFSTPARLEEDLKDGVETVRQRFFRLQRLEVAFNVMTTLLEGMIFAGLIGTAIWLWASGAGSIGLVAAGLALVFKITSMVEWFLDALSDVFESVASLEEALETVGQPLAIRDAPGAADLTLSVGAIRFDTVSHHYGRGHGVLDSISFTVQPGEKLALVGPSGAGKSTILKLLLRQFEAESGRIEIDRQDIRHVTQASLHAAFSIVEQEASLLHRSVSDNIALGRKGVTQAQIEDAAHKAGAHDFIFDLKDSEGRCGYDAFVGERGVKLSGGQRQRLAIARALLKDAPILLLDEATSALDSAVEADVQAALNPAMEGKTVIAIAHRLSTIAKMDRILVIDQGKIVGQGTHDSLLSQGGLYAQFWNRQSGGFLNATTQTEAAE